ncbi:MAG: pyruvate:ferredoxin (flavodoxin) oxidoreductase [Spirochaetales bacterium]
MKKIMMDGNTATAHVAYACSESATIYPITPSSSMAELCDEWSNEGKKNIFDNTVKVIEMQSEGGASGAMHGSLAGGALTTTFTASQGLLLMIPNMYKMAGELLPGVFHVSARTLATHALSIFGDQSDVMAVRQTGVCMLASSNPQEAMDIALSAHISAVNSSLPFLHFFDGFRTSHQINNVEPIEYETIKKIFPFNKVKEFKNKALNPNNPHLQGSAQNPDIFFQNREASNIHYNEVAKIVENSFDEIYKVTGRRYNLFDYYGHKDAEKVIVIMGSGADTTEETIDTLNKEGQKLGVVKVRLYRPFDVNAFINSLPKTVKQIAVLDKTKESGSIGEPLYLDVVSAITESRENISVVGGRYGLGGKDFTPAMAKAVFDNLNENPKNHFTVGIVDDVTNTSLPCDKAFAPKTKGLISCKFYGLGGDGTVSANKNAIKIIGENTDMYSQGFFEYDSKKSGSITISHLRFGASPIKANYSVNSADFIGCNNSSYIEKYDMLEDLKDGGVFLLNSDYNTMEQIEKQLPNNFKQKIALKNAKFYNIDALKLAKEIGLDGKINTIMQSVFFYLANIIDYKTATQKIKELIKKSYGKYGENVVKMNEKAVDMAVQNLNEIKYPTSWKNAKKTVIKDEIKDPYYTGFIKPILELKGDELAVSKFSADGHVPTGTSQYEKREIASEIPMWLSEKCIQCNQCSFVCPHGAIRPVLITEEEAKTLPKEFVMVDATGVSQAKYRMQINPKDCTGCGNCVNICPAQALVMTPIKEAEKTETSNYATSLKLKNIDNAFLENTVKGSQFKKPYFEFSGACAGCGETPYIKLVSQLFGDRMVIANATGCSSIYGGSAPTCPYAKDESGKGPAWANSLFEDNAEFGLGIKLAYNIKTENLINIANKLINSSLNADNLKSYLKMWVVNHKEVETCKNLFPKIELELNESLNVVLDKDVLPLLKELKDNLDIIVPKSFWIIGGDGWAYDIGYGGLDHVLASGENVNILVLDTQVYSNTGGQSSKASPTGSVAKFTAGGKKTPKKDLGAMAMTYKNVYVASVAMGANMNQLLKAITEAEKYDGPSLIIAYATCINHGIDMSNAQKHMKNAVDSGYWNLYRYNPNLELEGQNPFTFDSKRSTSENYKEFLKTENRYNQLLQKDPKSAEELFNKAQKEANEKIEEYKTLAEQKN